MVRGELISSPRSGRKDGSSEKENGCLQDGDFWGSGCNQLGVAIPEDRTQEVPYGTALVQSIANINQTVSAA
jgi:hypothetical protein